MELITNYESMNLDNQSGYYYVKTKVPEDISGKALENLRILVDVSNGRDFVRFQGRFNPIEETTPSTVCKSPNSLTQEQMICMSNAINSLGLREETLVCDADAFRRLPQYKGCTEQQVSYVAYSCIYNRFEKVRTKLSECDLPEPIFIKPPYEEAETQIETNKNAATIEVNDKRFTLDKGESVVVDGKTVTLKNVGSNDNVAVDVDGVTEVISTSTSEVVNGLEIAVIKTDYAGEEKETVQRSRAVIGVNGIQNFLLQGETKEINGNKITLRNVGSQGQIAVSVNGVTEVISEGNTEVVNGVEVTNVKSYYVYEENEVKRKRCKANIQVNNVSKVLIVGDSFKVEGKKITLKAVRSSGGAIAVSVNNVIEVIARGIPETVNGLKINNLRSECYELGEEGAETSVITPEGAETRMPYIPISKEECSGCTMPNGGFCVPFGTRDKGKYCGISKQFLLQKEINEACENNYECLSNECKSGKCVSTYSLLQRILEILKFWE